MQQKAKQQTEYTSGSQDVQQWTFSEELTFLTIVEKPKLCGYYFTCV